MLEKNWEKDWAAKQHTLIGNTFHFERVKFSFLKPKWLHSHVIHTAVFQWIENLYDADGGS